MERKDLIKHTEPDYDTISRNEIIMGESRDDLIEVKGEKDRNNINISDLDIGPSTPNAKNRSSKKSQNGNETTYSQVFNL